MSLRRRVAIEPVKPQYTSVASVKQGLTHSFVLPYSNVTTKSVQCPVALGSDNRGRSGKGPLSVPPEYFVQIVSIMSKSAVLQQ